MKKIASIFAIVLLCTSLQAQTGKAISQASGKAYNITVSINKHVADTLYIGQHFRDEVVVIDSCITDGNVYTFKGKSLTRGVYCLARYEVQRRERTLKSLTDFVVDDSWKFSLECDSSFRAADMKVKGSNANETMFKYIARQNEARSQAREIQTRQKSSDPAVKEQANKEMDDLSETMIAFVKEQMETNKNQLFFSLLKTFSDPDVPDEVENKPLYYRSHYWDGIDLSDHSLIRTPDLFNKMNYYFFGVLYYAYADTICKYAEKVIDRVEDDSVMMQYFLDFIMPKYYRSTKNIGWDYVWCHLVRRYYQTNRSGFALPGDVTYKIGEAARLEKSLIGAQGTELYMLDTMQREGGDYMISSHRFPQKYVIIWIWDPDCHHCQEQTAKLIPLYDSLTAIGKRNFEIYAIGYENDIKKWKNYVRDHKLPFVNVGGPNVNVDYQEEYNVHGAPTMVILNADRQIIMNKTLPSSALIPFFEQYEKDHPEQADRAPSIWQQLGEKIWGKQGFDPVTYFNVKGKQLDDMKANWEQYRK